MSTPARLYRVTLACGCVLESRFLPNVVPEPGDPLRCPIAHGGMPQTVVSVESSADAQMLDDNQESDYIWSE